MVKQYDITIHYVLYEKITSYPISPFINHNHALDKIIGNNKKKKQLTTMIINKIQNELHRM
jgi:hypothetical protein